MELGFIFNYAWLIPAMPLFSFFIAGIIIRPISNKVAGLVATLSVGISATLSYILAFRYISRFSESGSFPMMVPWSGEWLRYQESLTVSVGVLIDPLSLLLMVVVTTVSFLVHWYSLGYMKGDEGFGRYFTFLNLFTFSMLGLVTAPNLLQMFVCWELVGSSSFLLIGFYYEKPSAVSASKKAFIVTRFADLGFLLGILILGFYGQRIFQGMSYLPESPVLNGFSGIQPWDFAFLNNPEVLQKFLELGEAGLGMGVLTVALVLLFIGAAGKSAMFPLHIWLPDAMEGPTPVSALIHAATMVVAGVYLVARLFPAFAMSGSALILVAYVGAFTCLFAAVLGCVQDDIKRILAFSTLSQIGYMMFSLGVASMEHPLGYTASLFHLFTHAFFKALLFLGAGSVIHAVHTNNIHEMGGLDHKMPVTHFLFLIATLAISGIPPLSGFFSKDEILAGALESGHFVIFGIGLLVAGITAFYMFRLYFLTFKGEPKSHAEHAKESQFIMLIPMMILGMLAVGGGWIPLGEWVKVGDLNHHGINWDIALPAILSAMTGIGVAWFMYRKHPGIAEKMAKNSGGIYILVRNKFYIDEVYLWLTHRLVFQKISQPIAWFDRHVVDGMVNLTGWITRESGRILGKLQTGQIQTYGIFHVIGGLGVLLWFWVTIV
ncbi:MAG: NADH-quinone oxidoreductase subunit L [SAR324 cluster bacterium]|nr:NADH-quinone oxidoreductase subunit L [SAR324 cluster bacterium]